MQHICTHVLGCTTVTNLLGLLSHLRVNGAMFLGHPSSQLRTIKEGPNSEEPKENYTFLCCPQELY